MHRFPSKFPDEILDLSYNFAASLAVGETVTVYYSVTVFLLSGTDATPSAILSGTPSITGGTTAVQRIIGGLDGCEYAVRILVTTSAGRRLGDIAALPVAQLPL